MSRHELNQLREIVESCVRDVQTQFTRIAQMQAELDEVRRAWTRTRKPRPPLGR